MRISIINKSPSITNDPPRTMPARTRARSTSSLQFAPFSLRLAAVCLLALALSPCRTFGPGFKSPVKPFSSPPANFTQLVDITKERQPPVKTFLARLSVVAKGDGIIGSERLYLTTLFLPPDNISLKADTDRNAPSEAVRIVQSGNEVSTYVKSEAKYYRGTSSDLAAYPTAFYGVRPADILRTLLVGQESVALLKRAIKEKEKLLVTPDFWQLVYNPFQGRREIFSFRKKDGLIQEMRVLDPNQKDKIVVRYYRYAEFNGMIFPSRYSIHFPESGLTLNITVDEVMPNDARIKLTNFSLNSPDPNLSALPLTEWLQKMVDIQRSQKPPKDAVIR
jgi:hypothetical protein